MSANDPLIGQVIDGYRVEKLLGSGGMARVYRAVDEALERFVALKVIDAQSNKDADYRQRFRNEARTLADLRHPNIVGFYRFGEIDERYYLAMEYVDGLSLAAVMESYHQQGELMPYDSVSRIITQVAKALDYAHKSGVIHRDVKPSNIMLMRSGEPILTDFGLALVTNEGTKGATFGSPHYIAPEQAIASSGAVPQSDLYSLGVTLYEMLTGRVPFAEGSALQIAMAHMTEPPPDPRQLNPNLHLAFLPVLKTALEKEPEDRFQNGAKFSAALRAAIQEARKTPVKTQPRPARQSFVPEGSTPSRVFQLSQIEIPQKVEAYRQERPLTEVVGVKPARLSQQRTLLPGQHPSQAGKRARGGVGVVIGVLLLAILIGTGAYLAVSGGAGNLLNSLGLLSGGAAGTDAGETSPAPAVVEGVVRSMAETTLMVYDLPVTLPDALPLLQTVQVGDVVRIEGEAATRRFTSSDGSLIFTVVRTAYLNGELVRTR
jgi:serine/threonine protein kinase